MERFRIALEFGKMRISVLATLSMLAGYILAAGSLAVEILPVTIGVFLLACGASTINQIQEIEIDGRMDRTKGRPLPTGRSTVRFAWVVAGSCLAVGLPLILWGANLAAMFLGVLTVAWYNGLYTPLKRKTPFAAAPGGVVGAIPPMIGWSAGGGSVLDPHILIIALFFFVWQIPHFWLLLMYSCGKDYEKAGLPSLTDVLSMEQIARITYLWILATAMICLFIPLFGVVSNPWINLALIAAGIFLVWRSSGILQADQRVGPFRNAFKQINLYICWVLVLLSLNGFLG